MKCIWRLGIDAEKKERNDLMKKPSWIIIVLMILTLFSSCSPSQKVANKPMINSISQSEKYDELFNEANNYFSNHKWRKAEKTYKRASEYKSTYEVYYNIGASLYNRGKYEEAIKYFKISRNYAQSQSDKDEVRSIIKKSRHMQNEKEDKRERVATALVMPVAAAIVVPDAVLGSTENLNTNPEYQAWINYRNSGLPGASTISFEDFKRANAQAAANEYQIGNSSSTTSPSNNSSSITKTKDCPHCVGNKGKCSTCNGRGWIYAIGSSDHLDCPNCKHGECQWCNGTGMVATH